MSEHEIRAALDRHWVASDASDFAVEHNIYRDDAVLEYPQSGERISGRHNIQASRTAQPNLKRFSVRRIVGAGELWVTEFILTYDGKPSYAVSIMEFRDGKVARETQYFGDPFAPGPSRAAFVERIAYSLCFVTRFMPCWRFRLRSSRSNNTLLSTNRTDFEAALIFPRTDPDVLSEVMP
jgi:hypothetical protein